MSIFEFVYGFMSIVTGLAVAKMLTGFVELARNGERVRFSMVHALWAWCAFGTTIGNWAASWSQREIAEWPAWMVLLTLANSIGQYVFCAFVTPDAPSEGEIDLVQFHAQKRAGYLWSFFALGLLAIAFNVLFGLQNHYADWWRDTLLTLPMLAMLLLALFVRARWAQVVAAVVAAALTTYFLWVACNIAAG